jgi:hypothetical protein
MVSMGKKDFEVIVNKENRARRHLRLLLSIPHSVFYESDIIHPFLR